MQGGASHGGWPDERDDAGLDRWLTELRVDAHARARAHTTWLRRQAEETTTLTGVLTDLAERGRPVVVEMIGGRRHRGVLCLVGSDVCALRADDGHTVVLARRALARVRTVVGAAPVVGDRVGSPVTGLAEVLAGLALTETDVTMWCVDGPPLRGEIVAVGSDVVHLRLAHDTARVYVALASLVEVSVPESG